jgi:hypothetical protein
MSSDLASYYAQKADVYEAKIRRLQRGGVPPIAPSAVSGLPEDIASIVIQSNGKRVDKVYSGKVVAGVSFPQATIIGERSPLIISLSDEQASCVKEQVIELLAFVRNTYCLRLERSKRYSDRGNESRAHASKNIQFKESLVISWGDKPEECPFAITIGRSNKRIDSFLHGQLMMYAVTVPSSENEVAKCLGNVQFLNSAGNDITMSLCTYIIGKPCTFLTEKSGVATVATENIADSSAFPPVNTVKVQVQSKPVNLIQNDNTENSAVIKIETPVMPLPIAADSVNSAIDMNASNREFPNPDQVTSEDPLGTENLIAQGAIIDGVMHGDKVATVMPIDVVDSAIVDVSKNQKGGCFGCNQIGGFNHPSFGFSTYVRS